MIKLEDTRLLGGKGKLQAHGAKIGDGKMTKPHLAQMPPVREPGEPRAETLEPKAEA